MTATLQREQYRRRLAFSSSVSSSGATSPFPSLCVSFSVVPELGDREVSDGAFTVSVEPLDGAASEAGFRAEGSKITPGYEIKQYDINKTEYSKWCEIQSDGEKPDRKRDED